MPSITKDVNNDMEESNGERDPSNTKVENRKIILIHMNNEYMDKFHKLMVKFDYTTSTQTVFRLIDEEIKRANL